MVHFVHKNILRIVHACTGILHALKTDFSFKVQFYFGLAAVFLVGYMFKPLSHTELLFLGLAWTLILITELQNSSFEAALDRIHPELHDAIGKSKDMAAGAVMIAGCFALFVVVVILTERLF